MIIYGREYIDREDELKDNIKLVEDEAKEVLGDYGAEIKELEEKVKKLKSERNKERKKFREQKKVEQERLLEPARDYYLSKVWEDYKYDIYVDFDMDEIDKIIEQLVFKYTREEIDVAMDMSFKQYYINYDGGAKAFEYTKRIAYNRKNIFWVIPRECLSWLYQKERITFRDVAEILDVSADKMERLKRGDLRHGMPISDAVELKELGSLVVRAVEEYKESDKHSFKEFIENRDNSIIEEELYGISQY